MAPSDLSAWTLTLVFIVVGRFLYNPTTVILSRASWVLIHWVELRPESKAGSPLGRTSFYYRTLWSRFSNSLDVQNAVPIFLEAQGYLTSFFLCWRLTTSYWSAVCSAFYRAFLASPYDLTNIIFKSVEFPNLVRQNGSRRSFRTWKLDGKIRLFIIMPWLRCG
jgi:hypothetical protein